MIDLDELERIVAKATETTSVMSNQASQSSSDSVIEINNMYQATPIDTSLGMLSSLSDMAVSAYDSVNAYIGDIGASIGDVMLSNPGESLIAVAVSYAALKLYSDSSFFDKIEGSKPDGLSISDLSKTGGDQSNRIELPSMLTSFSLDEGTFHDKLSELSGQAELSPKEVEQGIGY